VIGFIAPLCEQTDIFPLLESWPAEVFSHVTRDDLVVPAEHPFLRPAASAPPRFLRQIVQLLAIDFTRGHSSRSKASVGYDGWMPLALLN
jgi:hypothetical protein